MLDPCKPCGFNLQGRLLASPSNISCNSVRIAAMVSICKADYWLPQAQYDKPNTVEDRSFNLQGRLLASPSSWFIASSSLLLRSFNLQGRLLASPSTIIICFCRAIAKFQSARQIIGFPKLELTYGRNGWHPVSICKADYWLPQAARLSAL